MEKLTLAARVVQKEDDYLATVDNINLTGKGTTLKEAQDDLVAKFMSWVQTWDGQGALEAKLLEAGYPGANEDTELELQFVE